MSVQKWNLPVSETGAEPDEALATSLCGWCDYHPEECMMFYGTFPQVFTRLRILRPEIQDVTLICENMRQEILFCYF